MKIIFYISVLSLVFNILLIQRSSYNEITKLRLAQMILLCALIMPVTIGIFVKTLKLIFVDKKGLGQINGILIQQFLNNFPKICLLFGDFLVIAIFTCLVNENNQRQNQKIQLLFNLCFTMALIINNDKLDIIFSLRQDWFYKYRYVAYLIMSASFIFIIVYRQAIILIFPQTSLLFEFQLIILIACLNIHIKNILLTILTIGGLSYVVYSYYSSMAIPLKLNQLYQIVNFVISIISLLIVLIEIFYSVNFIRNRGQVQNNNIPADYVQRQVQITNSNTNILDLQAKLKNTKQIWISQNNQSKQNSCSICRQNIQNNQQYNILKCEHIFHAQCIKGWFNERINCPNCRKAADLV